MAASSNSPKEPNVLDSECAKIDSPQEPKVLDLETAVAQIAKLRKELAFLEIIRAKAQKKEEKMLASLKEKDADLRKKDDETLAALRNKDDELLAALRKKDDETLAALRKKDDETLAALRNKDNETLVALRNKDDETLAFLKTCRLHSASRVVQPNLTMVPCDLVPNRAPQTREHSSNPSSLRNTPEEGWDQPSPKQRTNPASRVIQPNLEVVPRDLVPNRATPQAQEHSHSPEVSSSENSSDSDWNPTDTSYTSDTPDPRPDTSHELCCCFHNPRKNCGSFGYPDTHAWPLL